MNRVTLSVIVLGLLLLAGMLYYGRKQISEKANSVATIGGPFRLSATSGGLVDSQDLVGHPYGIFFGYTHCPDVCPTTIAETSAALQELGAQAKDFRFFFITVDPERDTLPVLKDLLANFDPRIVGLVPSLDELQKLRASFHLYIAKVPTSDGSYTMDHTASVFLFDKKGEFWRTLSYDEAASLKLEKLKTLLSSG